MAFFYERGTPEEESSGSASSQRTGPFCSLDPPPALDCTTEAQGKKEERGQRERETERKRQKEKARESESDKADPFCLEHGCWFWLVNSGFGSVAGVQGYLTHKKPQTLLGTPRALGIGLR